MTDEPMRDNANAPAPGPLPSKPSRQQRVLLVTGLSGAGKTTALRVLEDLGLGGDRQFPHPPTQRIAPNGREGDATPLAIGFDSRTRGFVPRDIIDTVKKLSARGDVRVTTLFLDCGSGELERRYNETRRRHPMASGTSCTCRHPGGTRIAGTATPLGRIW